MEPITTQHKPVTLMDVARHCGVSKTTVIRALTEGGRIHPATRERIRAAATVLGYNPNNHQAARRMILRRYGKSAINHVMAILIPPNYHRANYFADLVQGAMDTLATEGFATIIIPAPTIGGAWQMPPIFASDEVDAMIGWVASDGFESIQRELAQVYHSQPPAMVTLMTAVPGTPCVGADETQGAYLATRHLLELGHRHILHTYEAEYMPERIAGVHAAYREAGLPTERYLSANYWQLGNLFPEYHLEVPDISMLDTSEPPDEQMAIRSFFAFLEAHPEVTAILAQNDTMARIIGYLLRQAGKRIPEDYSLIGFDDVDPFLDDRGHNILSAVRLPLVEIGQQAARLAIQLVCDGQEIPDHVVMPTSLTLRGTTGAPAR